ncbi:MAG: hypothetical protein JW828_12595 [Sedimentisphaerales bacterium]|nr:hypothetical protein [Sedimentisphaerales bacterium]
MTSRNSILMMGLVWIAACGWTQNPTDTLVKSGQNQEKTPQVPYIAEVIGQDVYVRSGAGTAYYFTTKLNAPARVTVVDHKFSWAVILPPEGSFSWIYKNYVKLDPSNPKIGTVTGDNVRIWAGAEKIAPANSSSMQAKLNTGDLVHLIDPAGTEGDYYKIQPPISARLYISTEYLKYIGPVKAEPVILPPRTGTEKTESSPPVTAEKTPPAKAETMSPARTEQATPTKPQETKEETTPVAETETKQDPQPTPVPDIGNLDLIRKLAAQCTEIGEQIAKELQKPLAEQNYTTFKEALTEIANNPDAGAAKTYADFYLQRIAAFELVKKTSDDLTNIENSLQKARQQIHREFQAKLDDMPDRGKYILQGIIKPSSIYTSKTGQKRYTISNDAGRIIAYAVAADTLVELSLPNLIGQKVGLVGKIIQDPNNPVTLIQFTQAEPLPVKADVKTTNR